MKALQDNIQKYESLHGPIKNIAEGHEPGIPMTFGPKGEA
jgi:hypothetical protein